MNAITTLRTLAPHELRELSALTKTHLREVHSRLDYILTMLKEKKL